MEERTYKYIVLDNSGTKIGEFYNTNHLFMFLEGLNDAEFLEPNWKYTIKREISEPKEVEYADIGEL